MASSTPVQHIGSSNLSAPDGTYIYSIARVSPTSLAAISSDDCIRILDPTTLQVQSVIRNAHSSGINCLKSVEAGILATGGRDGAVKIWDTRAPEKAAAMFKNDTTTTIPILSLDVNNSAGLIAAGTEHPEFTHTGGDVLVWDIRTCAPKVRYTESHNDDVTELKFHPTLPQVLLSGSTDHLINIYNLLTPPSTDKSTADDDVENALYQVINHGSSVHHAGFLFSSPQRAPDIWAMSHDENLGIYRLHDMEGTQHVDEKKAFGDVRKPLNCEYVVDVTTRTGGGAYLAAGSYSDSFVNLVPLEHNGDGLDGWGFSARGGQVYQLHDAHGGEIVRSILVDDLSGVVFTAGEDGRVMAWKPPTEAAGSEGSPKKEKKEKRDKKDKKERKEKKEKKKDRFNPY